MKKYRKKPIIIEAKKYDGTIDCAYEIVDWSRGNVAIGKDGFLEIFTEEGLMQASLGDFIIKGIAGEFYPCKSDIFEATYDLVE